MPTMVADLLRKASLRRRGLAIAWNVTLVEAQGGRLAFGAGCVVASGSTVYADDGRVALGDRVFVGTDANLRATGGDVEIGSDTLLAQRVSLIGANHAVGPDNAWLADELAPARGVRIGARCWLGVGAVILPGVELGDRCVVGANAVVTRSAPAGSTLLGVPARPLPR